MKNKSWVLAMVVFATALPRLAAAEDVNAGPIWNQADANNKCPNVCKPPAKWNGQWRTTVPNKMSVCSCEQPAAVVHDVEAGTIWNQADADKKCPMVCGGKDKWNGRWRTTVPNKM